MTNSLARKGWLKRRLILVFILYKKENIPPIGAAKLLETPTAQAQASMSVFRDSF